MRNFLARVGGDDLNGEFDANLKGKPRIDGVLASSRLDLTDEIGSAEDEPRRAEDGDTGRLFSDAPLDTSWLQLADLDIELRIAELIANTIRVTDVEVGLRLEDGALRVDPLSLRERDGSIQAGLSLVPVDGRYELKSWADIDAVRVGLLPPDDDILSLPLLSGSLRFEGVGSSVRSIMASSNGQVSLRQGAGKVRQIVGLALFHDVFLEVLRTLNPLRRARDFQLLECGIYDVSVKDGLATIDNFIIQTDAMTTVATGEINLRNERLEIAFRAKPREGLGISLGTVANQLLEVRGTLKSPRVGVDAGRTATTTGAAVATGGLSLLARGLWDRLSAEGDICKQEPKKK